MAHSDKNIVITPNISSTSADPKIVFSGADASTGPQNITLQVYPTNSGTLSFEGSAGQLFSIANSMTGTIFSANDVSGIPSIEVLDSGLVKLAQYSGNVLLGSGADNATDKLQVTGSISATSTIKGTTLTSTVATGTSPLVVTSSTMVANLNANYWNGNSFSSYLNQGVRSGDAPTFSQVYASNWFRSNSNNTGLYNENNTSHFSTQQNGWWDVSAGGSGTTAAIRFYTGGHVTTKRGVVYADNASNIGFLTADENWALKVDNSKNVFTYGSDLTVGNTTSSNIYMVDTDNTTRRIHCNSNQIGFLNSSNGWGAYCDNSGNWYAANISGSTSGTNTGDQTNISGNAGTANGANGNFYIDDNHGCSVVGNYSSYRYQGVYAMGDAYKLAIDGTNTGSLYGLAWSHPNAGGAAGNLTDHGLLVLTNGAFKCAISNSIVASGNITAYSDERLKTNWRPMPENFVARLAQVKVGIYDRTDEEDTTQVGVSAQSFQKLLPQAIMTAKDDMQTLSVNYGGASLASAVELAKDNVELRARIEKLEALVQLLLDKQ